MSSIKDAMPLEIERKFLISMPDTAALAAIKGVRIYGIVQTYLQSDVGVTKRVRKRTLNGINEFILTEKRHISTLSCIEIEKNISEEEYFDLLKTKINGTSPVEKTRYAVPFGNLTWEIDIYPFWSDRAIAEVELTSEQQQCPIPPFISVITEVSADKRYKNRALAEHIPQDEIF